MAVETPNSNRSSSTQWASALSVLLTVAFVVALFTGRDALALVIVLVNLVTWYFTRVSRREMADNV